jgi:hypothetical protein
MVKYNTRQAAHVILRSPMKRYFRPAVVLSISIMIALVSAAVTYTARTYGSSYTTTAAYFLQTTPSPQAEDDRSEVGSTDGIVVMGGVIAMIVLIPILVRRKAWMQGE